MINMYRMKMWFISIYQKLTKLFKKSADVFTGGSITLITKRAPFLVTRPAFYYTKQHAPEHGGDRYDQCLRQRKLTRKQPNTFIHEYRKLAVIRRIYRVTRPSLPALLRRQAG